MKKKDAEIMYRLIKRFPDGEMYFRFAFANIDQFRTFTFEWLNNVGDLK